jgi:hypothetical protein
VKYKISYKIESWNEWKMKHVCTPSQIFKKNILFLEYTFHAYIALFILSFLTICCQKCENILNEISTKIYEMESRVDVESQHAMRFLYDQINLQPIEFKFNYSSPLNKKFLAGVS